MKAKRYDFHAGGEFYVSEDDAGEWVAYSDYAAIQQELSAERDLNGATNRALLEAFGENRVLKAELAAAREANARLCSLLIDSPRGLVEQVWTRKVSHEVTIDVMGAHLDMTGQTYRLVDEAAIATLQRDRQP